MKDGNDSKEELKNANEIYNLMRESHREEMADRAKAAEQDRKSKKTPIQGNIRQLGPADSWTLKEKVLLNPHLDWTDNQRRMAGLK